MQKAHIQKVKDGEWTYPEVYQKDGQWYELKTNEKINRDHIYKIE